MTPLILPKKSVFFISTGFSLKVRGGVVEELREPGLTRPRLRPQKRL